MDIYGTIRVRASIYGMPYREAANGFTVRYDTRTGLHAMAVLPGPTVLYREQHRAASADTKIGFVRYDYERDVRLRNDFFGNPYRFSIIPI